MSQWRTWNCSVLAAVLIDEMFFVLFWCSLWLSMGLCNPIFVSHISVLRKKRLHSEQVARDCQVKSSSEKISGLCIQCSIEYICVVWLENTLNNRVINTHQKNFRTILESTRSQWVTRDLVTFSLWSVTTLSKSSLSFFFAFFFLGQDQMNNTTGVKAPLKCGLFWTFPCDGLKPVQRR